MTISTSVSSVIARGNGVTTQFNFDFLIPTGHERVTLITPAGVQTILPASAYTLVGADDPDGGHVTYPLVGPAVAAGYSLVIQRLLPYTQPSRFSNQGGFYPESVEAALDWLEMQIQQGVAAANTGIHYPAVDVNPVSELAPAAARAGKFFAFDGNGNPTMLVGNLLAGDLLPYTLGGAAFSTPNYATMNAINMNAGWYLDYTTAAAAIVQGYSAHIERTAGADPNFLVGSMLSIQNRAGVSATAFGSVTEAINQPGATGALVGAEFAVANETNNCIASKVGVNLVFKDRGDGVATVTQGLGANEYNVGSWGIFISSQTRSTAGEFCGWRRGIYFDPEAIDADVNGGGIGIDFAKVHYYGGSNPLTAYRMTAAIRLRDFQSILWNGDPTLANDPTEPAANAIRTFFNSSSSRWILSNAGVEMFGVSVTNGDIYRQGVLITPVSTASNNVWTGTNTYQNTFTLQTDLVISGAHNFTGDFSNATLLSRANFKSTTVNGQTAISAIPNGASPAASWNVFNAAGMANCAFGQFGIGNAEVSIQSTQLGGGAVLPLTFYCGAAASAERMRLSTSGNLNINTTTDSAVGAKLRVNGLVQIDNACAFTVNLGGGGVLIGSNVFTQIAFNNKFFDQQNMFNTGTGRLTPPAGKYHLTATLNTAGGIDQARFGVYIFKNGAAYGCMNCNSSGTLPVGGTVAVTVDANGTDYFEVFAFQTSGVNYTVSGNVQDSYFTGHRVG